MGRLALIGRLAVSDLRRRPAQAALLLIAIMAATTTLALALALHGVTSHPYQETRAATAGPDLVAEYAGGVPGSRPSRPVPPDVRPLLNAPGVTGHSGPFLTDNVLLRARGITVGVVAEARGQGRAPVDRPLVTSGTWVRPGTVVLERTLATALGVRPGDTVNLGGRRFTVAGTAVTAALPPFPNMCQAGCMMTLGGPGPGLAWVTPASARALAGSGWTYVLNLRLADPARAPALAAEFGQNRSLTPAASFLIPWQAVRNADGLLVADEQSVLNPGSWLLGLLALATVAVLTGGRMTEQTQRVGRLKAAGGTPGLIAAVLLAENLILALLAAALGLAAGWLAAPLLTSPGAGLVGAPGGPSLTLPAVGLVAAMALAVALVATLVPALRAARTSTVVALADAARPPRRRRALVAVTRRLPAPLLVGLRLAGRRPRRLVLSMVSAAVTAAGIDAVLAFHAMTDAHQVAAASGLANPVAIRDGQVLAVVTVALVALAALNAVVTTWATVLDTRHSAALTRALGATQGQVSAGLSAAQLIAALPGVLLGIPAGLLLYKLANSSGELVTPPAWWLASAAAAILAAVALLAVVSARAAARATVAVVLQTETA
ncbi:MAG TPA: FtsX-like permease family protein [Streptosporangiaceae bacterium]|nr:FtsX-like permease family protein [Streptosporangiaceae bacterium]